MAIDTRLACDDVMQRVTEYLDEALPPGAHTAFERHLAECANCTRHLQEIRQTIHQLGALPREPMPAAMKDRLLQALHSRQSA
ncbi:MAG TPA: zf-HC2 domain-containing protein [Longimicrobium sp.]|nr:zf-HC2 domain-containing protein [Longimicrobium sp.]